MRANRNIPGNVMMKLPLATLILASGLSPAFAADAPPYQAPPEQAALMAVQQQRNAALVKAADVEATIAYLQAQSARLARYWDDYVKGLAKPPETTTSADKPPESSLAPGSNAAGVTTLAK